jgi:hypothetical protein
MKNYNENFYVYKFNNEKNIVNINRKNSSLCDVCNVVHDNENAYLLFNKDSVSLGCYRNKNNTIKNIYKKDEIKIQPIDNNIDNKIFNKLLLTTLEMRKEIKKYKQQEKETQENILSWGFDSIKNLESFINKYKNHNCINKVNKKDSKKYVSKKNGYNIRTSSSFDRYLKLGNDIINKKDSLNNLVKQFGNEKNIYKVKQKALRVVKYFEVLKNNNIDVITTTLKNIFNMKKIEFSKYLKNIPPNIK